MPRETRDAHAVGVSLFLGAVLVVTGLVAWLMWLVVPSPPTPAAEREPARAATPPLQLTPRSELAAIRAVEDERLRSYGWIDREAGVARIPIDRAMEILSERESEVP